MPRALPRLPRPLLAVLSLSLTLGIAQADTAPLFSADGYRTTHYRSPTPQQVEGGQVVDTTDKKVPAGAQGTSFMVTNPDGWPVGRYTVEVLVDGQTAHLIRERENVADQMRMERLL